MTYRIILELSGCGRVTVTSIGEGTLLMQLGWSLVSLRGRCLAIDPARHAATLA